MPNKKRLERLRDMIAGIPEDRINLDHMQQPIGEDWFPITTKEVNQLGPCNSICCIAGWAWLYPPFIKQGIRQKRREFFPDRVHDAARFFDTPELTFAIASKCEEANYSSHKAIALARIDQLLEQST